MKPPQEDEYDPFEERDQEHKTSDYGAFSHVIKGCIGAGILAMPMAFSHSGWVLGTVCTILIGAACTYCMNLLVFAVWEEQKIKRVPFLTYGNACEASFLTGPKCAQKCARGARILCDSLIIVQLLGICSVYVLFAAINVQEALKAYVIDMDVRLNVVAIIPVLICISLIKTLKFISPISILANILIGTALAISFYYFFDDLNDPMDMTMVQKEFHRIPLFFGIVVFSLEGIGVVLSIENSMKNPKHFIYCPSILNISMVLVSISYLVTGLCGYLCYGDKSSGNIVANLPMEGAGLGAKVCVCLGILFSYCIQFYPPMEIIWNKIEPRVSPKYSLLVNYLVRFGLVLITALAAIVVPNLSVMMSLMGSVCLSILGFVFPPLMEYFTFFPKYGNGRCGIRLIRTILFSAFGMFALTSGIYSNILELVKHGFQ